MPVTWNRGSGDPSPRYNQAMSFTATVLRVMIASPSDTSSARDAVESAISRWNAAYAHRRQMILLPWRWETSAVPQLGAHPQTLINSQGVDESDILIGLFGGRLGSPTPNAISGTVEEIERAKQQGKPVHIYFSSGDLPNDVDTAQLNALRDFRKQMQQTGLLGEFDNVAQLEAEITKAIEFDLEQFSAPDLSSHASKNGVEFLVQPQRERLSKGLDSRGRNRYETMHWIEITNNGDVDAENVTFEAVGDNPSLFLVGGTVPTTIHRGQKRRVDAAYALGGSGPDILRIRWMEGQEQKEQDFHV